MHNRLNKFFSPQEFTHIEEYAKEYLLSVLNTEIALYQIDRDKVELDQRWPEVPSNELVFLDPVSLPAFVQIYTSENKAYDQETNTGRYSETGQMDLYVLNITLKEFDVKIRYGDYIGYAINNDKLIFYQVMDDDPKNFSNEKTFGSYESLFKIVKCVPVDSSTIEFLIN
jgi:hypothetical protein